MWGDANAYDEARAYRDPRDGKHYPSVTSILNLVDKPGLSQFAADEAVKWCVAHWMDLGRGSEDQAVNRAKYRWKDVANERGEVGDGVHNYLEAVQTGSWSFPDLDEEQQQMMQQYQTLTMFHDIQPLYNEVTCADLAYGWFGTFDSFCLLDGVPTLVDFKTSKGIHDTHYMQLAALANATEWFIETEDMKWEVIYPPVVEQCAIFHLRADSWEVKIVDNLDLHYRKFLNYTDTWYANQELKDKEKGK